MGYRYIPEDMIRHSDFYELYKSYSQETREKIDRLVDRLIRENPENRLPLITGPGYFMMHWLMADLYVSLSIYIVQKGEGNESGAVLEQIDRCLTVSGEKLNKKNEKTDEAARRVHAVSSDRAKGNDLSQWTWISRDSDQLRGKRFRI